MTAIATERPRIERATTLQMVARAATETLPPGVIGQVGGIALVYNVIDTWRTTFRKGCLTRTVRERVAAGKVRLYLDHGDMPINGMYDTHLHIGVVRRVWDDLGTSADGPDLIGKELSRFAADIFDTEAGREAHEYLQAIAATGSETGVSIGMMDEPKTTRAMVDGQPCEAISELALREISITSMSSIPGTRVTSVRADLSGDASTATDSNASGSAPAIDDSDAPGPDSQPTTTEVVRTDLASVADRLAFCRSAFQRLYD